MEAAPRIELGNKGFADPYVPNEVLYQAELLPEEAEDGIRTRDPHHGKVMFYH